MALSKYDELRLKFITEEILRRKEAWIEHYIFYSGKQWGGQTPTREEAEAEWEARFKRFHDDITAQD